MRPVFRSAAVWPFPASAFAQQPPQTICLPNSTNGYYGKSMRTESQRSSRCAQTKEIEMTRIDTSKQDAIGLDIGTSRMVTARQTDKTFHYNVQLNGFV